MATATTSAVPPLASSVMWSKCSKVAALSGPPSLSPSLQELQHCKSETFLGIRQGFFKNALKTAILKIFFPDLKGGRRVIYFSIETI
jgi:hypothetical protein